MVSPFLDWQKHEVFDGCRHGGSHGLRKVNTQMGKKWKQNY